MVHIVVLLYFLTASIDADDPVDDEVREKEREREREMFALFISFPKTCHHNELTTFQGHFIISFSVENTCIIPFYDSHILPPSLFLTTYTPYRMMKKTVMIGEL